MLEFLRKKAQSPFLQAAVLVIIVVFIFWGTNAGNGGPDTIATVNDQSIPVQAYQKTYDRLVDQYREQFGGQIPPNLLENLGLKEQALQQLVEQELVRQGALEMGLAVSDEEVRRAIQEMEVFRTGDNFDLGRYEEVLSASRMSVGDFETDMRADLLRQKVLTLLGDFARVSPREIEERFAYEYGKINLQYAALSPEAFTEQAKVTEEGLAAFFAENKTRYRTEPQLKVQYVSFPFTGEQEVSEAAIESYYQQNLEQYRLPEKRRARHILIKTAEGDSPEEQARKREQLEGILAQAREGGDFAELARKHSEDSSAASGGDLGFFSRGQMVAPFEEAAFSLAEGEISNVVETRFGYHLIKVEEVQPARTAPLAEVKESIAAKLRRQEAKTAALQEANQAYEQIILSGSLEKYAEQHDIALKETDFFTRQTPPAALADDQAFLEAALNLREGELSSLITGEKGYAIIFVEELKKPEIPALEEVRERAQKDFIAAQAKDLAREAAANLLAEVKAGAELDAEAGEMGLEVKETGFISRRQPEGNGLPPQVLQEGLSLSAGRPYPEEVAASGGTFYVLRFKEYREPSAELFAAKKDELKKRLEQQDQMALLAGWVEKLKTEAEITRNEQIVL